MTEPSLALALLARCTRALSTLATTALRLPPEVITAALASPTDIEALHALTASALAAQTPASETP